MGDVVQLTVAGRQQEIRVKEYQGQRVVTFRDINRKEVNWDDAS